MDLSPTPEHVALRGECRSWLEANLPWEYGRGLPPRFLSRAGGSSAAMPDGTTMLLIASAFGAQLPLPLGVVGHEGSTVLVVLNGLRLLRYKA